MNEAKMIALGLIEMLKAKEKMHLLPEIIDELDLEQEAVQHQVVIESAVSLSESDIIELISEITDKYGIKPHVIKRVEPDLLGGVKLKIGDQVIDLSIKHKLQQLKRSIN